MMILSLTADQIVAALEKGAVLTFHYAGGRWSEYAFCSQITLDQDSTSIQLHPNIVYPPDYAEDTGISPRCEAAYTAIRHSAVRQRSTHGSEYSRAWTEVYEHTNQPVPRWVHEQWDINDNGNPVPPNEKTI